MSDLIPVKRVNLDLPERLQESTLDYLEAAVSGNTRRAYEGDWKRFVGWCTQEGRQPYPARSDTVLAFLADMADKGLAPTTISRMKSVIKAAHVKTDQIDPTQDPRVSSMLKGIKKTRGHRAKKAAPILVADLNRGVQLVPDTLRGLRDKAMVLLGFAGALRRSEVVNIDVENLERLVGAIDDDGEHLPDALHVYISRSKGDREASGTQVTVFGATNKDVCPINTLYEWLAAAKILSGPTFLEMRGNRIMPRRASDQAVNKAVKDFVKRLGYDTAQYSGHSLRTGAITEMDRAGRTSSEGRRHSRHKSEEAYDGYVQRFNPWKDHPMRGIL